MAQLAWIVGASSGVGAATAKELARRGYQIVLTARRRDRLESLAQEINAAGCYACDASLAEAMQELAQTVRRRHGIPDAIINCAGQGQWKRIEETSLTEAQAMMASPYLAAFNASQIFMRDMLQRGSGVLIHVNSPACFMPWPSSVGYTASRFALRGLHEALCQDLAGTGVHSCHVVFGRIDSEYFEHNPGVLERMPGISVLIPTLSVNDCARTIAKLIANPRRQSIYPMMLRLFYGCYRVLPGLTSWLLRISSPKTNTRLADAGEK